MPLYTEHLNLGKPNRDERYDIAVSNGNMDIIDETVQRLEAENQALRAALAGKADVEATLSLTWHTLEPLNGAELQADGRSPFRYAKHCGIVMLSGCIKPNATKEVHCATLPAGFRPKYSLGCACPVLSYSSANAYAHFTVSNDGTIIYLSATNPNVGYAYALNTMFFAEQ